MGKIFWFDVTPIILAVLKVCIAYVKILPKMKKRAKSKTS